MMFKPLLKKPLIFVLLFIYLFSIGTIAVSGQESEIAPTGEILLIHSLVLNDDDAIKNLDALSTIATSLIRSMDILTVDEALPYVENYNYIICYGLDNEPELARVLFNLSANVFVIGGSFMQSYITANNLSEETYTLANERAVLNYNFGINESFEEIVDVNYLKGLEYVGYKNGNVTTTATSTPFCADVFGLRHIPIANITSALTYNAVISEIRNWLWPYANNPPQYGNYLVLEGVDAFLPADELLEKIEVFVNANVPFVISVSPVYQNYTYPDMEQFCQVLKYAQLNNGAIIIKAPIVRTTIKDYDEYSEIITEVLTAFTNYGVYPLGIQVSQSVMYDEAYLQWLQKYRTVFVYNDEKSTNFNLSIKKNLMYYNYHQLVMPIVPIDDTYTEYESTYTGAIYINNSTTSASELKSIVEKCLTSKNTYRNLFDYDHAVWANEFKLLYTDKILSLNDEIIKLTSSYDEYNEEFDYNRDILYRISIDIQNQSSVLIIFVSVVTFLFIFMIFLFRRRTVNKFFYKKK